MTPDNLLDCLRIGSSLKGTRTKQRAIEFLKCLKEHDILIYWNKAWKLIARSKSGRQGSWKSYMEYVMAILEINSKEDWERIKGKYGL